MGSDRIQFAGKERCKAHFGVRPKVQIYDMGVGHHHGGGGALQQFGMLSGTAYGLGFVARLSHELMAKPSRCVPQVEAPLDFWDPSCYADMCTSIYVSLGRSL